MKTKRKRTEKVFEDYNDYRDRPFGLKWGPAFAIDELNKVIEENKLKEKNKIKPLPLMSREAIDKILQYAFLKSKRITIQLNVKDDMGNLQENIEGDFKGFADFDCVYVNDEPIEWDLIRNIAIVET